MTTFIPMAPVPETTPPLRTADAHSELIDVVDEQGRVLATEQRSVVHARGLLHRVAHVLLLRRPSSAASRGELLLARRAAQKKIGPRLWDLSVAEHVAAGEKAIDAACRGLAEELGVRLDPARFEAVETDFPFKMVHEEVAVHDNELVTLFVAEYRGAEKDGHIVADPVEVAETAWFPIELVGHLISTKDHVFTPWMIEQLKAGRLEKLADRAFAP